MNVATYLALAKATCSHNVNSRQIRGTPSCGAGTRHTYTVANDDTRMSDLHSELDPACELRGGRATGAQAG